MTINKQIKIILTEILKQTTLEITFTKVNGENRTMRCTLQSKYLTETHGTTTQKPDDLLAVFDNDKEQWRSMKIESITNIKNQGEFNISVNIDPYTVTMSPISIVASNDSSVYSAGTDENLMVSIKDVVNYINV